MSRQQRKISFLDALGMGVDFYNSLLPENSGYRIEWRQEAFDAFLDSLKELASEFTGPLQRGGADMKSAPYLEAKGTQENMARLVRLSDAVAEIHLFYGYALRKVFAVELKKNLEAVHGALSTWAGKKVWQKIGKLGATKAISNVWGLMVKIARTADAIEWNRKIAQRIRFHGRASRLGVIDNVLFPANKRSTRVVRSRHGHGHAPWRTRKSDGFRDQRTLRTINGKQSARVKQLAKARRKTRSFKKSRKRKKKESKQ